MPPINELTRIEPVHLGRLERQGIFTTGLLIEVSETPTRRQTLADQVDATTNDVLDVARRGAHAQPRELRARTSISCFIQAGIEGLRDILELEPRRRSGRASSRRRRSSRWNEPSDLTIEGWWDQAKTLEDA